MGEKKSFLLYISSFKQIRKLTQTQKGDLLDAIMNFQEDIPLPEMDPLVDMCFGFIADDMRRDAEKYEEIVEKRRESGRKGGKATQANQANAYFAKANQANATSENQANQANQAVNVNVDVNEDVNGDVDVNVKEPAPAERQATTTNTSTSSNRPSNQQILNAILKGGYCWTESCTKRFIDYNEEHGWKLPLDDAMKLWDKHEHPPDQGKRNTAGKFGDFPQRDDQEHKDLMNKVIQMQIGG